MRAARGSGDDAHGLDARLDVRRGTLALDATLDVGPGRVLALLGPNGAGKTTALHALAGLVPLDGGHVRVGTRDLVDVAAGVDVPAERRGVGVVFAEHRLFAHLDAVGNVAFGLRAGGVGRAAAEGRAREALAAVGLGDVARSRPRALSAGQSQRVALARALVGEPELLLLDEPLAALDAHTRVEIRAALRSHLARTGASAVVVSHDLVDAWSLADDVVVLEAGVVTQRGTPAQVLAAPATAWVARLTGVNLLAGTARGTEVVVDLPGGGHGVVHVAHPASGPVVVTFSPAAVALYPDLVEPPHGSPRNTWAVEVTEVAPQGDVVRVRCAVHAGLAGAALLVDVTPGAAADLRLAPGARAWAVLKATEATVRPR